MLFALLDGSAYYRSAMCVRTAATEAATFYAKRPDASDADVKAHVLACVKGTEGIEFSFSTEDGRHCGERLYDARQAIQRLEDCGCEDSYEKQGVHL